VENGRRAATWSGRLATSRLPFSTSHPPPYFNTAVVHPHTCTPYIHTHPTPHSQLYQSSTRTLGIKASHAAARASRDKFKF